MKLRRTAASLAALAALAALVVPSAAVQGDPDLVGEFTGLDGLIYTSAPPVVHGLDGELYAGFEFDYACGLGGRRLENSIDELAKFAALLRKSGRRVVYTVAPGKTWGLTDRLDPAALPHGLCDSTGVAQQNKVLDQRRPDYLPLRPLLRKSSRQTYWKTDPHWTTVGASIYSTAVARALSPALGRAQDYSYAPDSRWGDLAAEAGDTNQEVAQRAVPANGVKVRTAPGAPDWAGYPTLTFDHSWISRPARKTWPGHTLMLGDSFMWYALDSLRPIFRHGRFVWVGKLSVADLMRAIVRADTVVIESYAAFGSPMGHPAFRRAVRHALAKQP